jgi:alkylated DNA repair dioxygenase AlkB
VPVQGTLIGHEPIAIDRKFSSIRRVLLSDGAWLEYAPGWLSGHAVLFDELSNSVSWRTVQETLYDKTVDAPRLIATLPEDGAVDPILEEMRRALSTRYDTAFERISLALYRDGRDSVAWHGDRVARRMESTLVATVSVGAPRRFLVRPRGGGPSRRFDLGWGDLIVMGGSCQRTWQHSVPKVAHADPRIAIMFRPSWEEP